MRESVHIHWLLLVGICFYLSWTDMRQRRIPNIVLLVSGIFTGLFGAILWGWEQWMEHLFLTGGILLAFGLIAWHRPALIGMGDVKLLGLLGFALGMRGFVLTMTWACAMAFLVCLILLLLKRIDSRTPIPFAPFLTVGLLVYGLGIS